MEEHAGPEEREVDGAVVVRLGEARYALPMRMVAEVGRLPQVTRVPGVPDWVAGTANWRGRILPVLDLRPLLGTAVTAPGTSGRLVVVTEDSIQVGIVTEGVESVIPLEEDQLVPVPGTLEPAAAELLAGQVVDERGPVGVLAVDAVMRLRDRLPRARAAG